MSCAPPADDFDALSADAAAARIARQAAVLRELTDLGMALARRLVEEAAETAPEAAVGAARVDPALSFSRLSRAVRLTLALENRLFEEAHVHTAAAARPASAPTPVLAEEGEFKIHISRESKVAYAVEDLLEHGEVDYDEAEIERLLEDAHERLSDVETDDDFADAPVSAVVARICADLGLTPDWTLWADEDWAKAEAREGIAGSPYERSGRPGKVAVKSTTPVLEAAEATGPP